jgi:orotate phosphoribosyltransferase
MYDMYGIDRIREDTELERLLRELHRIGFIAWSEEGFTLKSKIRSHVYVCGREDLTLNAAVLKRLGLLIYDAANSRRCSDDRRTICLIGIPTAATPLAQAAAMEARSDTAFLLMREAKKLHGMHQRWTNGSPHEERFCYMTIENVVTSGRSLLENIGRLEEDGFPVRDMKHLVLVDREQGGLNKIHSLGYDVEALFSLSTIAQAFVYLRLWKQEQADAVNREIEAHQF